jgi:Ca-activated chloride channel family protein
MAVRTGSGLLGPRRTIVAVLCALTTIGWFGAERDHAAEGNRLYDASRYDEAVTAYGEGLVDFPESRRLRFNLAAAQYKEGNFADAATTLEGTMPDTDVRFAAPVDAEASTLTGSAAYNLGNARFRLGESVEEQDPQQAIALYEQALVGYKRAMFLDPDDEDPKFNHEFVARHLAALKERLEEEAQQQEQQQQEQQQQGQQQQEQPQPGKEGEQEDSGEQEQEADQGTDDEQPGEQEQEEQAAPQQGPGQEQPEPEPAEQAQAPDQQPAEGSNGRSASAGEPSPPDATREMTAAEAQALIDAARGEEVSPAEMQRPLGVAVIGEPDEDW